MKKIISVHSFRRGTGKSSLIANIAAVLALEGRQIGVLDVNLVSPSLHILFKLHPQQGSHLLNHYLWGQCAVEEAVYDVTPPEAQGHILLVPASDTIKDIQHILRAGYSLDLLTDGCARLIEAFELDLLLLDAHAGLSDHTLAPLAAADSVAVVMRNDKQDFQGVAIILELARRLKVPDVCLIANEVPLTFDFAKLSLQLSRVYQCEVAAVLPFSNDLMSLASGDIFVIHYPSHPLTTTLKALAARLSVG